MFTVILDENSKPIKILCGDVDVTEYVLVNGFHVTISEQHSLATMTVNCIVKSKDVQ